MTATSLGALSAQSLSAAAVGLPAMAVADAGKNGGDYGLDVVEIGVLLARAAQSVLHSQSELAEVYFADAAVVAVAAGEGMDCDVAAAVNDRRDVNVAAAAAAGRCCRGYGGGEKEPALGRPGGGGLPGVRNTSVHWDHCGAAAWLA